MKTELFAELNKNGPMMVEDSLPYGADWAETVPVNPDDMDAMADRLAGQLIWEPAMDNSGPKAPLVLQIVSSLVVSRAYFLYSKSYNFSMLGFRSDHWP